MATEAEIPVPPLCEIRGENSVDSISVSELSLETKMKGEKWNEHHPIVEGENFLTPPSTLEVHCKVNNVSPPDVLSTKIDDQPVQVATSQQEEKNGTNHSYSQNTTLAKEIVQETSDELQSKSDDLNSSFAKTSLQNGDKSVEASESHVENTSSESNGDVECQSKNSENAATDHIDPKFAKKSEESSLVQNEEPQNECDENMVEESATLPLEKEPAKDNVEDLEDAELIQNTAESLRVAPGHIEVSNLSQENNIKGLQEEENTNATLHVNTIEAVDTQKQSLESCPSIVSSSIEEGSANTVLEEAMSENTDDKIIDEVDKHMEVPENLSIVEAHYEMNNVAPKISEVAVKSDQTDTLDDQPAEFSPNEETSVEEIKQNAEESERNVDSCTDSSIVTSEMKEGDKLDDSDATVVTEVSKHTSSDQHGISDSFCEDTTLTKEIVQETSNELHISKEIVHETTNELQSKSDLNSSFSKEEETTVENDERSVATSEDHGVPSENTLSKSHGDEECHSKNSDDASSDYSDPKLAEKSEESSLVQNEDSHKQSDDHLQEDKDEDLKDAQVIENEQSTRCSSPNEDEQIENTAQSSLVTPECIQVSNLSQENNIQGLLEEEITKATLHEHTIEAEEATIYAKKQSLESCPPVVSSPLEERSKNAVLQEVTSEYTDQKIIEKLDKHIEVPENISIGEAHCEINNVSLEINELVVKSEQTVKDGPKLDDQPVEFAANEETTVEEIQQNAEESNITEKDDNKGGAPEQCTTTASVVISEVNVGDALDVPERSTSHGDEECKSKTSEDAATDHSYTKLAEKLEESTPGQVDGSQIECDEPLTEASTEGAYDNVSEAIDKVKDEDLKEFELSKNEQSTLVKEGMEIEHPAESLHITPDVIEVSELCQGNIIEAEEATTSEVVDQQKEDLESSPSIVSSSPEEGSTDAVIQEVTKDQIAETVEEADKHKEVLENLSTTVSTEDATENSLIKLDGAENKNEDELGKESEEKPLPLPLAREASDETKFLHENQFEDEDLKKAELCVNERSMLPETESAIENTEDSLHATSEGQEIETTSAIEEQHLSTHTQETQDRISDEETVDAAEAKEDTLENVPTTDSNEKTEDNSSVQVADREMENEEHLEKENSELSLIKDNTGSANIDETTEKDEIKIKDGNASGAESFVEDKNTENILLTEEVQSKKPSECLHAINEDVKTPDLGYQMETSILHEQIPADNPQEMPSEQKATDAANTIERTQELQNVSNEDSDRGSLTEDSASEMKHDADAEEETERATPAEASKEDSIADELTILNEPNTVNELPNDKKSIDSPTTEKENLQNAPEDHKTSTSSEGTETISSLEEQSIAENPQAFISNTTIDAAEKEDLAFENVATEIPHKHIEEKSVSQVDCSEREQEEILEKDSQNSSLTEAPIEEANAEESKDIDQPKNEGTDSIAYELENEENTESTFVQEEVDGEKPIETLQIKPEDVKHDSCPEISSNKEEEQVETHIQEQILIADIQESCDKTQERTVDAATERDDVNNEGTSLIEEDGSQKPSPEEVLAEKINDDEPIAPRQAKFANENTVNANLVEEETNTECALVKKEVYAELLRVADEHIKATSSVQDREASHLEEQAPTTDSEGTIGDQKDGETTYLADPEEKTVEYKNNATAPDEDRNEDSPVPVDESTSFTDAPKDDGKESTLVREEAEVQYLVDSSLEADIVAFDSCQDTEISSNKKQIPDVDDICSNQITEKTIEATEEEIEEAQDIVKSVPQEEDSLKVEDSSHKSSLVEGSLRNIGEYESKTTHESEFVDESLTKDELLKNEKDTEDTLTNEDVSKDTEDTLTNEDVSIALPQVAAEDIKEPFSSEVREINSEEEQILNANPAGVIDDNRRIDPIVFEKETPRDEVPKEIGSADIKETPMELKAEEGYLNDLQMTSSVNSVAAHQEKSSDFTSESTLCAEDLDVKEDVLGPIPEVSNYKQQESSITEMSDEHMTTQGDHNTSLESDLEEKKNDQVVEEANGCGDKMDSEKIEVLNDDSIAVPAETDPESTEVEVQEAEIEKNINEALLTNASEDVSESKEVNGEEKIDSNNCEEILAVALQEVSTSNAALEEDSQETREETETEVVQKQESELQAPELIQDSSVRKIERDEHLPAPEENLIETTDCKEIDAVECATNNVGIDHPESFSDDKKPTEEELEETVASHMLTDQEEPCKDKTTKENDEEIKIGKGDNDEKEAYDENIPDISSAAPDMIEARDTDVAELLNNSGNIIDTTQGKTGVECSERSAADLETKTDDEAPEMKETTPLSVEGQDVESACAEEHSDYPGSSTGEMSDSNEAVFAPGENTKAYESNNQVVKSIAQVQSCELISEKEEMETGEQNLKAKINSDKAVAEDIFQQEETSCETEILKGDILSEKEQLVRSKVEDEDIKDQGYCEEDLVKQEQQKSSNETVELIKDETETEKVSEVSEEANDKALEDLQDEVKQEQQKNSNETVEFIKDENETEKVSEVSEEANEKVLEDPKDEVKQEQQKTSKEPVEIIQDGNETEKVSEISEEANDKVPEHLEEKVWTNESIDGILHQEEQAKSIEEPITKIDTEKAHELDNASATNASDSNKEGVQTKGISECAVSDGAQDIPEDSENFTTKSKFSEEGGPSKSTEFEVSSAGEDIAVPEQASEATAVTAEVQEAKAGIDLGAAVPKDTAVESREVEEVNDKCKEMAHTSAPVESPVTSESKIIPECTAVEVEDQHTKFHDNFTDSEVKMTEKDDAVNLHSLRDISEDVQELSKESSEVSNNENTLEGGPEEKIATNEGQETKPIETLQQETEEQLGRGIEDVHEEQKEINCISDQLESEKVTESSIHQSSVEDTAQHDKKEGSQQIDSPPLLEQAECSDMKPSEKDLIVNVAGSDSLPLKDKHVVLEADDTTKNVIPENSSGETEGMQDEHETVEPSKVVQAEAAECGIEERSHQERDNSASEKEPTSHNEEQHAENSDESAHENSKTDDEEEESHEEKRPDVDSEAPVMVDMGDADVKAAHKKSHNILSGVGSKVKHSIAKVKKAITGKSSHPKTPSPKKMTN